MKSLPFDPLDPQRDKVYAAELEVFPRHKDKFLTLEQLQVRTDDILSRPWFRKAYPDIKNLSVRDGRGSKWSRVSLGKVHLLKVSRVDDVLIHEIVHQGMIDGAEWHGAVFCGMLLFFVGKLYDQKAKDKLRRAFKRNGVVWDKRMARWGDLYRPGSEGEK